MRKKAKRFTALLMIVVIVMTSFNSMIMANETENESRNEFGYVMYATSYEEGAITIDASNICINGNLLTNGTIENKGNMNHNGEKIIVKNDPYHFIYNHIYDNYFSVNCDIFEENTCLKNDNLNLNNPMLIYGELSLVGNVNLNSSIQSMAELNIIGNTLNANNAVIMSKYNDINISSENVSITGLIYAPFGVVNINANNCNLNNVIIIASKINIQCGNLNVNYNSSIGKNISIESETTNLNREDWKYVKDTDGDGLNDYYETYYTFTDITFIDTDDNGVLDFDEDEDDDLLTNGEELIYKTHPLDVDSDNDGLLDGDEVNIYNSNPIIADHDGDGLIDGDEVCLNTDIFNVDTDGDGITDDKELFEQTYKYVNKDFVIEEVSVEMECNGNIDRTTTIEDMLVRDDISSQVVGLVGSPYEINTKSYFEEAKITFKVSDKYLETTNIEDLLILWYDETNNEFVAMDTEYDYVSGSLSTTTVHFSQYMIVDSKNWFKAWMQEIDYYSKGEDKSVSNNTAIVLDCSGSMNTYDRISKVDEKKNCYRIEATESFISAMGLKDSISIITFANDANVLISMSDNKTQLQDSLQSLYDYGGTNFNVAIKEAIGEFSNEQLYADKTNNRIIFMSDGIASCSGAYLAEAKSKGIVIHTVGLGDSSGDIELRRIAEATGGTFMKAVTAQDLVDIFTEFGLGEMDTTDTDGDGLYDVIEASGIRLQNGTVIYTKPYEADSDGDGLLDGEEIDPTPLNIPTNIVLLILSKYEESDYSEVGEYYFRMISDPNNRDTDGDGYSDKDEIDLYHTKPTRSDLIHIDLDEDYVNVKYEENEGNDGWKKGNVSYGSSQNWLYNEKLQIGNKFLQENGCGLIAFCDVVAYTTIIQDYGDDIIGLRFNDDNTLDYDTYINYINKISKAYVDIDEYGITSKELKNSFNYFYVDNALHSSAKIISWDCDMYDTIYNNIRNDYPVIMRISYCKGLTNDSENETINLYTLQNGKFEGIGKVGEHYVTITGIVKDTIGSKIWLKVSSWGNCYYIDYDEYINYKTSNNSRDRACDLISVWY